MASAVGCGGINGFSTEVFTISSIRALRSRTGSSSSKELVEQGERFATLGFWIRRIAQFIMHDQAGDELVFLALVVPPAARPVAA